MDKQVEIKKIVIRIGDKEATLTPEDAKALRDVLNEMFGEREKEKEYIPYPYPTYPFYPYRYTWPRWDGWTITCGDAKDNTATFISAAVNSQSFMASVGK